MLPYEVIFVRKLYLTNLFTTKVKNNRLHAENCEWSFNIHRLTFCTFRLHADDVLKAPRLKNIRLTMEEENVTENGLTDKTV